MPTLYYKAMFAKLQVPANFFSQKTKSGLDLACPDIFANLSGNFVSHTGGRKRTCPRRPAGKSHSQVISCGTPLLEREDQSMESRAMAAVVTTAAAVWTHHGDATMRAVNMFFSFLLFSSGHHCPCHRLISAGSFKFPVFFQENPIPIARYRPVHLPFAAGKRIYGSGPFPSSGLTPGEFPPGPPASVPRRPELRERCYPPSP